MVLIEFKKFKMHPFRININTYQNVQINGPIIFRDFIKVLIKIELSI